MPKKTTSRFGHEHKRSLRFESGRRLAATWVVLFCLLIGLAHDLVCAPAAGAVETWEKLDKRLKGQVFHLNVGLKVKLKDSLWAQFSDLAPRTRYPVFSTSKDDKGFRVVGWGTAFPVRTNQNEKTYFLTNRHVIDSKESISRECERFYAAMRFFAEQNGGKDVEGKYKELLQICNYSIKKDLTPTERGLYQTTIDAIWDTYDKYLTKRADPGRLIFKKCLAQTGLELEEGYYLHAPGPASQKALEGKLYKLANAESEPDIAVLTVGNTNITCLDFDTIEPTEGQEIQVIGYPTASDQIDTDSGKYFAPTFSTGRVSRVTPKVLQVDAPITSGNSGGPVVSLRGRVLGVVANRAKDARGNELNNFGGAITVQSVQGFAPELFSRSASR